MTAASYSFDFALEADARRFADDCDSPLPLVPHITGYRVDLQCPQKDELPPAAKSLLRRYGMIWPMYEATAIDGLWRVNKEAPIRPGEQENIADALTRLATQTERPADDITAPDPIAQMPGAQILAHLGDLCRNAVMESSVRPHHVGVAFLLLSMPCEFVTQQREMKPTESTPKHALLSAAAARLLAYPPTPQDVHLAIYFWQRLCDAEFANLQAFPVIVQDNKTGQLGMQRGAVFCAIPRPQAEQLAQQRVEVAQTAAALQRDLGELIRRSIPGHLQAIKDMIAHARAADEADKGIVFQDGGKDETKAQSLRVAEQPAAPADDRVGQVIHGPWNAKR